MREVEGGNRNWLMRILRHEATRHRFGVSLRRGATGRDVFGSRIAGRIRTPPPRRSARFVQHLERGCQAHRRKTSPRRSGVAQGPIRLAPGILGLAGIRQARIIDGLAADRRGEPRRNRSDAHRDVADEVRTLRQHYEDKLARYECRAIRRRRVLSRCSPPAPRPVGRREGASGCASCGILCDSRSCAGSVQRVSACIGSAVMVDRCEG